MNYDQTDVASRYAAARELSKPTMRLWSDAIARHVRSGQVRVVLDVGCGTGRFSTVLASQFDAKVIGMDPSRSMLKVAQSDAVDSRVRFVCAAAEDIPARDGSICLAFMSMVYHHLPMPLKALREIKRVLRIGGYFCLRNSTREFLHDVRYLQFFPSALAHNRARLPSRQAVLDTATRAGLSLVAHDVVKQQFATSLNEYCDKISQRALSDLVALPDTEFDAGLVRMRAAADRETEPTAVVEPIDLFIFENGNSSARTC